MFIFTSIESILDFIQLSALGSVTFNSVLGAFCFFFFFLCVLVFVGAGHA
jgi:hypothetical protein